MKNALKKLHWQVAMALAASVLFAVIMRSAGIAESAACEKITGVVAFAGTLFMRMLSMIVVPLVVTSVVCGSMSLGRGRHFLRIGVKTVLFYLGTGLLAVLLSLLLINIIQPGAVSFETAKHILGETPLAPKVKANAGDITGVFLRFFPPNVFAAASDNTQLLSLIVFAVIVGIFINTLPERYAKFQENFWNSFNELFQKITNFIMIFLPIGVFGLTAPVCLRAGTDVIMPVAIFFLVVTAALAIHTFVTMSAILWASGINPLRHIKIMLPSLLAGFSTSSSVATLPVTLECVEVGAGVPKDISGFTIPLGATVNMNGSALYECAAVIFISQIYASAGGAYMPLPTQFLIVILALLTSIGVAGIPSASLVAIVVIMGVAGIPVESVGIVWMTDRILDMMRTAVNVYGDSCAAVWIAKTENRNFSEHLKTV